MVMVSSAYYSKIDPDQPAAFSPTVIKGMLRRDLGFAGVVISDDLAARGMQDLRPGTRAVRFLRAGGDLVIVGDPGQVAAMATPYVSGRPATPDFSGRREGGGTSGAGDEGAPRAGRLLIGPGLDPSVCRSSLSIRSVASAVDLELLPARRGPVGTSSGVVSGIEA